MSYSFYVNNVADVSLAKVMGALPYGDLATDGPAVNGSWPEFANIYREGISIRPVETAVEDGTLQVRIFSGSAPEDYALGLKIAECVGREYGQPIVSEEGETSSADKLSERYSDDWAIRHSHETVAMLLDMGAVDQVDNMKVAGVHGTMALGPRVVTALREDRDGFAEAYFKRFRMLNYPGDVFQASIIVLRDEATKKLARVTTLTNGVATLLPARARFLALNKPSEEGSLHIKFDDFLAVANSHIDWVSEDAVYVPAIDGDAWQALLDAAKTHEVLDLMSDPSLLDEDDGEPNTGNNPSQYALVAAPVCIFLLVAAADGEIDDKEITAFQANLLASMASESDTQQTIAMASIAQFPEIFASLQEAGPGHCVKLLTEASQAAEKFMDNDQVKAYRSNLNAMAIGIAKASGGGFLGFGNKIGKEEKAMLELIEKILLP